MSQVGATIKRAMAKAQISQNQLADETGVSRSWIASVNTGKIVKPDPSKLARIAPVLGLDLNQLLAMTDQLSAVLVKEPPQLSQSDAVLLAIEKQTDLLAKVWGEISALVLEMREQRLAADERDREQIVADVTRAVLAAAPALRELQERGEQPASGTPQRSRR